MFGIKRLADDCKNEDILEEVDCKTNDKKEIEDETISFPEYSATVFKYLNKDKLPRNWFIQMISSPWFGRVSMFVIIIPRWCVQKYCASQSTTAILMLQ